jgi:thiol-disulfide isomerase/thioredoxin
VPSDWNPGQIAWRPYVAGLAEAQATGKPVVLIFYTDWCPHCHNYSRVFYDREVVELAARFVMIRVERDGNRDISRQYDLDGDYIPRTFFLRPNGELLSDLDNGSSEYRYYLDEHGPGELLSLMREALSLGEK